jgi:hypothetical protein
MSTNGQLNDFVVSLAGTNIDLTIVNIEEMDAYCKARGRFANVVTEKKTYEHLDSLNYSLIMNYKHPIPRVVNTKSKQYLHVYNILSEKYRSGLLVAEADTISEPISENLCKNESWGKNDIDIMICRSLSSVTMDELKRANLLRISADTEFDPMILNTIGETLKDAVGPIMIAQMFANENYDKVKAYMDIAEKKYSEAMTEYIDYNELRRQLAYFVYVDVPQRKIVNVDRETIRAFMKSLPPGMSPVPAQHIDGYCDMITVG